jgi:hypothetical protein
MGAFCVVYIFLDTQVSSVTIYRVRIRKKIKTKLIDGFGFITLAVLHIFHFIWSFFLVHYMLTRIHNYKRCLYRFYGVCMTMQKVTPYIANLGHYSLALP